LTQLIYLNLCSVWLLKDSHIFTNLYRKKTI